MTTVEPMRPVRYRTIFVSDAHLGFRGARADYLLEFLDATESEYLYLVGDMVDIWEMRKRVFWPREHALVVRRIMEKAWAGTKVVYLPGNHDEAMRDYNGSVIDNFSMVDQVIHTTQDGRRLLVLHGDQFDTVVKCSRALSMLGSRVYGLLLRANHWVHLVRRLFGFPYWSLAAHLKYRVKNAMAYISSFEEMVAWEASRQGVDGVVCGHIHHAEMREVDGVLYCNDGDWVESCTCLVENHDGRLELLRWLEMRQTDAGGPAEDGQVMPARDVA
ncbi:UDP-2,3-diacylglucosamine diphosphatase [Aquisalimonas sp. 2447]|uniref:UDP-2,3-diacylglucosamine diphosphatase n=1 Tax=Aquisalimonas sp. 2447 TaxID=2740807 RepID=UPI0014326862|nr:UDP-2,3-diacylglucosamine diphosphatase [Aquisalimonas sp. 2447]QIT54660.1 UDP-2,3-diacylglucosamine diphosphatase [Aquisalimonas sp. 2447]